LTQKYNWLIHILYFREGKPLHALRGEETYEEDLTLELLDSFAKGFKEEFNETAVIVGWSRYLKN
jgi:hypothetical protein